MRRRIRIILSVSAAVPLIAAIPARADQLVRKAGEWHSVVTGLTPEPRSIDLCFAAATAEQVIAKVAEGKQCTKRDIKVVGNQVFIDITCSEVSLKGNATMFSDSAYKADLTLSAGTGSNVKSIHTITDAKWIGACKPGEKPQ